MSISENILPVKETRNGILFHVLVLPRSAKCSIVGIQGDALKIRITAPPVEGQANQECIRFLSDKLGVKKHQITIAGGHKSKKKIVSIEGLKSKDVMTTLASILSSE
jgi:uncharacterized protein (TIGR00251 family)